MRKVERSEFALKLAEGTKQKKATSSKTKKCSQSLRTLLYSRKWIDAMERIATNPEETEIQDAMGDLPLHEVCHTGGAPFQIIQRLIHTNKAALQKRGFCGRLPLHYAAYSKPSVNVIKLLLRHFPGAVKEIDDDGRLPLHLAVIRNAPKQSMQAIIDAYPRALKTPNKFGSTPVMLARNEHVEALLKDEVNRPRDMKKKIQTEKKLVRVWNDTKLNPVSTTTRTGGKNKKGSSRKPLNHPNRAKPAVYPTHTRKRTPSPTKKKPPKFERKQKSRRELQQNTQRISSPRSPTEVMSSVPQKHIPSPERGRGNYRGVPAMSSYRATHLPKGIPSPAKGSGNYGAGPVMSNYRRNNLPSPTRFSREVRVPAQ